MRLKFHLENEEMAEQLVIKAGVFGKAEEIVYRNLFNPKRNDQLQYVETFLPNQSRYLEKWIPKDVKDGVINVTEFQSWKFILLITLILSNNQIPYL